MYRKLFPFDLVMYSDWWVYYCSYCIGYSVYSGYTIVVIVLVTVYIQYV